MRILKSIFLFILNFGKNPVFPSSHFPQRICSLVLSRLTGYAKLQRFKLVTSLSPLWNIVMTVLSQEVLSMVLECSVFSNSDYNASRKDRKHAYMCMYIYIYVAHMKLLLLLSLLWFCCTEIGVPLLWVLLTFLSPNSPFWISFEAVLNLASACQTVIEQTCSL